MTMMNQHTHIIPDFTVFDSAVQYKGFAYVEHHPLLHVELDGLHYFCIRDPEIIAAVVCEPTEIADRHCLVITRSWVAPGYRNRGYMKALMWGIVHQRDTLASDSQLSPQSVSIWRELYRVKTAEIIDIATGVRRPPVESDFVTDHVHTRFIMVPVPNRFWKPMTIHLSGYQYFINNRYLEVSPKP